jgi:hypothetical protein
MTFRSYLAGPYADFRVEGWGGSCRVNVDVPGYVTGRAAVLDLVCSLFEGGCRTVYVIRCGESHGWRLDEDGKRSHFAW